MRLYRSAGSRSLACKGEIGGRAEIENGGKIECDVFHFSKFPPGSAEHSVQGKVCHPAPQGCRATWELGLGTRDSIYFPVKNTSKLPTLLRVRERRESIMTDQKAKSCINPTHRYDAYCRNRTSRYLGKLSRKGETGQNQVPDQVHMSFKTK